jgi:threonine/homoserine/homoserine lactone efflux protein
MELFFFLFQTVMISFSGVMAPGPVTAVTISKGHSSPHAGAFVALGHGIIEIPLIILIFFGLGNFINMPLIKISILIFGAILLIIMGISLFRDLSRTEVKKIKYPDLPIVAGMLLSISNPYFFIWWATVGTALVIQSNAFGGITGFSLFAFFHWLSDFLWLYFLSILSYNGTRFFGKIFQKIIFVICGILLIVFSIKFLYEAFNSIWGMINK